MLSHILNIWHQIDEALTGTWPTPGQYAVECPKGWQPRIPKVKAPKVDRENVYSMDDATKTFGFRDRDFNGPGGNTSDGQGVAHLTEYDCGLWVERFGDLKPEAWARATDAKACWNKGMSKEQASDHLKGMGYKASVSFVEKAFGTYSTALDNEKSDAGVLQN